MQHQQHRSGGEQVAEK